jgi:hypothetical protein
MNRRRLLLGFVGILASFTLQATPLQQPPPSTTTVKTHAVDSLTGQAIARPRFTLTGGALLDGMTGTGDVQGDLVVSEVPPGRYQLTVEKAGYFPFVISSLNVTTAPLTLPNAVMTARREISGTVRWQDGEVAARAQVRVMTVRGGKPVDPVPSIPSVSTNDLGEFVVPNLQPGRYILVVSPPTFSGGLDATGRFVSGGTPRVGVPVFYPGVTAPDARASLDVRGTLNVRNIGIVLEERPGTIVEGTVVPSAAAPAGSAVFVTLNNTGLFSVGTQTRSGDAFRIGPVPSGFYVLDAQSQGPSPSRTLLSLTVGGATLSGVAVSIPPPAPLSGRVEIDDPALRINPTLRLQSERIPGTMGAPVSANGEFRIPLTITGETYRMTVGLPQNANVYIAAVRQGAQEKLTSPFSVAAGGDPVQIVLKTDGGTLDGIVKDGSQAFVVLAPKDRRLEQHFRTVRTGSDGTFKIFGIAPGDYDLIAFDRNEDDDYLDEVFLRGFEGKMAEVKAAPRSTKTIELPLNIIPRH